MSEQEIPGQGVLNWMCEAGVEDATRLLVGCGIDDNQHEDLLNIVRLEPSGADLIIVCELAGELIRIGPQKLRRCIVVDRADGFPLASAVEQSKPQYERKLDEAKRYLRQHGVNAERIAREDEIFAITEAMKDYENNILPSPSRMNDVYEAFKRAGLHHNAARVFERWLSRAKETSPRLVGSLLIKLAYFRRSAGDLDGALAATDVLQNQTSGLVLQESEKGVLAAQRAAILLDIFGVTSDDKLCEEAKRFAKMAWAIRQSPKLSLLFRRLDSVCH